MPKKICVITGVIFLILIIAGCSGAGEIILNGTVEYTEYDIVSQAAGSIDKTAFGEGDSVKQGDVIALVDSSMQDINVRQAEALVRAKQIRLDEIKKGSREEQIALAEAGLSAAQARLDDLKKGATNEQIKQARAASSAAAAGEVTAKTAYNYAKTKYGEAKTAFDAGLITKAELNEAKFAMDTAYSQYRTAKYQHDAAYAQYLQLKKGATGEALKAAEAEVEQAEAQLDLVKNGSTQYVIDMAQADLDAANAQLDQAKLLRERCSIKSPVNGTLSIVNVETGCMVNAGGYIATVIDDNDVWMNVYITQSNLKYVSLGQKIKLECKAWPGSEFAGEVAYISNTAEFTPKNVETGKAKENTVFKIKLKIYNHEKKLKAGMTVDAKIPLS